MLSLSRLALVKIMLKNPHSFLMNTISRHIDYIHSGLKLPKNKIFGGILK